MAKSERTRFSQRLQALHRRFARFPLKAKKVYGTHGTHINTGCGAIRLPFLPLGQRQAGIAYLVNSRSALRSFQIVRTLASMPCSLSACCILRLLTFPYLCNKRV